MATDGSPSDATLGKEDDAGSYRRETEFMLPPGFEAYADEPIPQASVGAPGKAGELDLTFAPDTVGRTRLVHDYARVPYHLSGTLNHDRGRPDFATVYVQAPQAVSRRATVTRWRFALIQGLAYTSEREAQRRCSR